MKKPEYNTTKGYLLNTPVPRETMTYKPVYHEKLIDLTLEGIHKAGFTLASESYTMASQGLVANGKYKITNVKDNEMQLQIGWQNSYDKTTTLKFAIGAHIFICSNGSVHGSFGAFKKKHSGSIQQFTPQMIKEYLQSAGDIFIEMQKDREAMKEVEMSKRLMGELIGRAFIEEELINSIQLNIIKTEIKKSQFNYHPDRDASNESKSLWDLYNYTTYALKEASPNTWIDSHKKVNELFVNSLGELHNTYTPYLHKTEDEFEITISNQMPIFK